MKKRIIEWLGLSDILERAGNAEKRVVDLQKTITSLEERLTDGYNTAIDTFLIMNDLIKRHDGKDWWDEDHISPREMKMDSQKWMMYQEMKKSRRMKFAEENPSLKKRMVFHGGCLSCITPTIDGIGACTGCSYGKWGENYPDLSKKYTKDNELPQD